MVSDGVESFFLSTVVSAVESSHPRDVAHRAIAGFSRGGYGAVNIALRHSGMFGQVASVAGYFDLDDPSQMVATPQARSANRPYDHPRQARGERLLLLEDRHESLTLVRGEGRPFGSLMRRAGIPALTRLTAGGHDLVYLGRQLPLLQRFFARGWDPGG